MASQVSMGVPPLEGGEEPSTDTEGSSPTSSSSWLQSPAFWHLSSLYHIDATHHFITTPELPQQLVQDPVQAPWQRAGAHPSPATTRPGPAQAPPMPPWQGVYGRWSQVQVDT